MARKKRSASACQRRLRGSLRRWMNRFGDKSPSVAVRKNRAIPGTFHIKVVSISFRKMTLFERYNSLQKQLEMGRIHSCDFNRIIRTELWYPGEY